MATDIVTDNFEQSFNVRLLMFNHFRKEWFIVFKEKKVYVVPPQYRNWDGKKFTLKNSFTEFGQVYLNYWPEN